jgi:hypothetical protein
LNTLIPLESYATFYYNVLLVFVLIVLAQASSTALTDEGNLRRKRTFGIFVLIFVVLYLGLRPISYAFGDMAVYAEDYLKYQFGMPLRVERDVLFEIFMQACSQVMPAEWFFLLCAAIYVVPLFLFAKKIFAEYWFYAFFILVISFSFWAYGTNGIRNGIATSLFLFALSRKNKIFIAAWMFLSFSIHTSMIVPAIAYIISLFYKNTKMYFVGWLLAIPLSLILGSFWENFFMGLGLVEEQRIVGYLSGSEEYLDNVVEIKTGFRWDFLIYSATGVFAGWYYIIKKGYDDLLYRHIFSVYLIANALWILVIRANFSNRIAYLSWFILGVVIVYPLLKVEVFPRQHRILGGILAIYFVFTYVLNVILVR